MALTHDKTSAWDFTPRWGRWAMVANVVMQTVLVVTGGLVRLTGSGLGCPTWPECVDGSVVPTAAQNEGFHKFIEFGNRTLSGPVLLFAILTLVAVWRSGRPDLRKAAIIPVVLTLLQAVIGGITVLMGLYPATVAVHLLVSLLLVGTSLWVLLRSREGDGPARLLVPQTVRRLIQALCVVGFVTAVLGTIVTGAGPHSGDVDVTHRWPIDVRYASWLHADSVLLFVGLLIGALVALKVTNAPARTWWWARLVLVVTLSQAVLGYVQFALKVPVPLVLLHMLGACILALALTGLVWSVRERGPVRPLT